MDRELYRSLPCVCKIKTLDLLDTLCSEGLYFDLEVYTFVFLFLHSKVESSLHMQSSFWTFFNSYEIFEILLVTHGISLRCMGIFLWQISCIWIIEFNCSGCYCMNVMSNFNIYTSIFPFTSFVLRQFHLQ